MNVEIICVGTELLLGEVLDTNSHYLAKVIAEYGLNHYYRSIVGDNRERILAVITTAFERGADLVMMCGGLGPTQDDVTKQVAAEFLGLTLVNDPIQREIIAKKYARLAEQTIPESVYCQADFPSEAEIFPNDNGTAPGCLMTNGDQKILVLPGPPAELKLMVETYVRPVLKRWQTSKIYSRVFNCFGLGESVMEAALFDLELAQTPLTLAPYASEGTSRVRVSVQAIDQATAKKWLDWAQREIEARIGETIYSVGEQTLPQLMSEHLAKQRIGIIDLTAQGQLFWQVQVTPLAQVFVEQMAVVSKAQLLEQLQVKTLAEAVVRLAQHFDLHQVVIIQTLREHRDDCAYALTTYNKSGNIEWTTTMQSLVAYHQQPERTVTKLAGYFWQHHR
ncbi:MAG: molybdopterin-binding protein [Culicoidibacterales bacterium]